jgi:hypothetical protein
MITAELYDSQFAHGVVYFDGTALHNHYRVNPAASGNSTGTTNQWGEYEYATATDYGRGNNRIQPYDERFVGVGSYLQTISGLPYWNTRFDPSVHNALSGAGVWGNITSNIEWGSIGNISLPEICRYPKETNKDYFGLASVVSSVSPSEDSPIDIIIDISDRPISNYIGFWVQFDYRHVAEEYSVHFDTTNDGTFDLDVGTMRGNHDPVSYRFNYQEPSQMVYRIKISITKALQIPSYTYMDANYGEYTIDYNPDGLVGIVNVGMPSNEVYGRAFLGECGGNMYGNVDMHQNTLKNLPDPVDDGDAVSKAYLEESLQDIETALDSIIAIQNELIGGDDV